MIGQFDKEISRLTFYKTRNGVSVLGGFDGTESASDARDFRANVVVFSGNIGANQDNADNCFNVFQTTPS